MGAALSDGALGSAVRRAEKVLGHSAVVGRFHKLPKRIEDDYEILSQELGTGYNGAVHVAENRETGEKFAVKEFSLYNLTFQRLGELELEAEIYLSLDHPHVARLYDIYQSRTHVHIVVECLSGGELFYRVEKMKGYSEADAAEAFYQMLLAVNYLHSNDIVHRDLKLENFLYETEDSNFLKVIDFGFSDIWKENTTMAAAKGTLAYMPPEVLARCYTSKCDMWSLGVILFIMLSGYMPFHGSEARQRRDIQKGEYKWKPKNWENVSKEAEDLVRSLLKVDPNLRPSAEECLANNWVNSRKPRSNFFWQRSGDNAVDPEVLAALTGTRDRSRFRRVCLSMMAWSLNQQERAMVRNSFMALDKNRNGSISLQEFKEVVRRSQNSLDDEIIEQIFKDIDTSGDNEIHYTEFLASMVDARLHIHDNLISSAFHRFDSDNTGQISYANLKTILGDSFSDRDIKLIIMQADADKDGQISYAEFYNYLKSSPQAHSPIVDAVHSHKKTKTRGIGKVHPHTRAISVHYDHDEESELYEYEYEDDSEELDFCDRLMCRH